MKRKHVLRLALAGISATAILILGLNGKSLISLIPSHDSYFEKKVQELRQNHNSISTNIERVIELKEGETSKINLFGDDKPEVTLTKNGTKLEIKILEYGRQNKIVSNGLFNQHWVDGGSLVEYPILISFMVKSNLPSKTLLSGFGDGKKISNTSFYDGHWSKVFYPGLVNVNHITEIPTDNKSIVINYKYITPSLTVDLGEPTVIPNTP